jgi:hypothetical protein
MLGAKLWDPKSSQFVDSLDREIRLVADVYIQMEKAMIPRWTGS